MKDKIGENDVVPSLLVFGTVPRFPIVSTKIPSQRERMKILSAAQMEMNAINAERRVLSALNRNIPPTADRVNNLGDKIVVLSEQEKKWIAPFVTCNVPGQVITVQDRE